MGPKTSEQEAKKGLRFANILGCENDTLACLQSLPAYDIMLTVPFLPRGSIDISLAGDQAMLPGKKLWNQVSSSENLSRGPNKFKIGCV